MNYQENVYVSNIDDSVLDQNNPKTCYNKITYNNKKTQPNNSYNNSNRDTCVDYDYCDDQLIDCICINFCNGIKCMFDCDD